MLKFDMIRGCDQPRVLVVSMRGVLPELSRCLTFEFEDLIAEIDAADVVTLSRNLRPPQWKLRLSRLLARASGDVIRLPERAVRPDRQYDLLFVPIQDIGDVENLGDIRPLIAACRHSICYVDELWETQLPSRAGELARLAQFDQVATGCSQSVQPLQRAIGKPCFFMPAGNDAIAFHPAGGLHAERPVDVYWMGRRSEASHQVLLDLARERDWFYLYDSFTPSGVPVPHEHRRLLGSIISRTKFFIANKAKCNVTDETGGQEEVGFRFFEGAAGGAIMLGDRPSSPSFEQLFGWPDAVVDVPFHSTEIGAVIEGLLEQPDRMIEIRRQNLQNSLRHHDWAHRWATILDAAQLRPAPGLVARTERLEAMAEALDATPAAAMRGSR